MTEEQKYQGALYKNKKAKTASNSTPSVKDNMAYHAFVEDVGDFDDYDGVGGVMQTPLPAAPSPPQTVNVFDFQVNPTPNQSTVALPQASGPSEAEPTERNQLVRFEEPDEYEDIDADMLADDELVTYGVDPIPIGSTAYQTPVPRSRDRRRSDKDSKKDKKRKRLHVSTRDLEMTDAPTLPHSGLTGGLNRMTTGPQTYPPSPDYSGSGGEFGETPASPLKKSKHSKHHKSGREESGGIMNSIASIMSSKSPSKAKKRKSSSTSATTKKRHSRTHSSKRLEGAKEPRLIGYKEESQEDKNGAGTMVLHYDRPVDLFFGMANKYLEKDRGCSVKTALRQFHKERSHAEDAGSKSSEEKELLKSLRMRRNDRGEIVLFCV